jgi:inner membrane protein
VPSPVGHTLIGLAVAAGFFRGRGTLREFATGFRRNTGGVLAGVLFANLPDVDYVPGLFTGDFNAFHHYYTHSLGWALMVACGGWMVWKLLDPRAGWRVFAFLFAALASHLPADWLTADARPPIGIMALWPLSDEFTLAPATIFPRLSKRDWAEVFQWRNVEAVFVEVAICLPLALGVAAWKLRSRTGAAVTAAPVA